MNIDSATTNAALLVGLAIAVLIAAGWRKPARASGTSHRAERRPRFETAGPVDTDDAPVHEVATAGYRPPSLLRRLGALAGTGGMALIAGALLATLIGYGAAFTVIRLTGMLKR